MAHVSLGKYESVPGRMIGHNTLLVTCIHLLAAGRHLKVRVVMLMKSPARKEEVMAIPLEEAGLAANR